MRSGSLIAMLFLDATLLRNCELKPRVTPVLTLDGNSKPRTWDDAGKMV